LDERSQSPEKEQEQSFSLKGKPFFEVGSMKNGKFGQEIPFVKV
jgi:hypothetical protein